MNKHSDETERLALYLTTAIASRFDGSIHDHITACAQHMRDLQTEIERLEGKNAMLREADEEDSACGAALQAENERLEAELKKCRERQIGNCAPELYETKQTIKRTFDE